MILILPHELLERILLLLGTESILACKLVNREFNAVIQSSKSLQYFLTCRVVGVVDNPRSPLSYPERLEALLKREDAWRTLTPVFETMIQVNHEPSPVYDLTAGTYLFIDNIRKNLYYCHLPSSPQDNLRWIRIPGHGPEEGQPGFVVSFAIAIYEHDLIINIISSEVADEQRHSLDLVLLKFSTGEYHPLARRPRIHVQMLPSAQPFIFAKIVSDHLALVVCSRDGTFPDKLFIFDWKAGYKRLQFNTNGATYSSLVFVSPELLLVPNLLLSHFEIWHLPPSYPNPKPPVRILSLKVPTVSRDYTLFSIICLGEPSPFLHTMPYFPPRPFFPSPENSLIIANFHFSSPLEHRRITYSLVMHRHALLNTIQKWTSLKLLEQLINEIAVHSTADSDDESVRLGPQTSTMPHLKTTSNPSTFAIFPTSPISDDSDSSFSSSGSFANSSTSRCKFSPVQWADWGPPISRWFQTQAPWLIFSNGQRYAFSDPNPRDRSKVTIGVADFNPHNFRNANRMARLREGENGNKEEGKEEEELEKLDHEGAFSEEVYMGLKCEVYHAPGEYDFDIVLIDEERLLGVKLNREGWEESIKVLYFG